MSSTERDFPSGNLPEEGRAPSIAPSNDEQSVNGDDSISLSEVSTDGDKDSVTSKRKDKEAKAKPTSVFQKPLPTQVTVPNTMKRKCRPRADDANAQGAPVLMVDAKQLLENVEVVQQLVRRVNELERCDRDNRSVGEELDAAIAGLTRRIEELEARNSLGSEESDPVLPIPITKVPATVLVDKTNVNNNVNYSAGFKAAAQGASLLAPLPQNTSAAHNLTEESSAVSTNAIATKELSDFYSVLYTVNHGAFGQVLAAKEISTGGMVALKCLRKVNTSAALFLREVSVMLTCDHPNICRTSDYFECRGHYYFAMEFMPDGDLLSYVMNKGRLSEMEAKNVFHQIYNGLDYLHDMNVAHRDIKLENVLRRGDVFKISDFGLCSSNYDRLSQLKTKCGTIAYAAPELFENEVKMVDNSLDSTLRDVWFFAVPYCGRRIDIFSLGAVLYTMVSGNLPIDMDKDIYEQKAKVVFQNTYLTMEVKNLITRMLEVNPNERITMSEIKEHYWFSSSAECQYGGDLIADVSLMKCKMSDLEKQVKCMRAEIKLFEELLVDSVASESLENFWITARGKNTYCDINISMLCDNPNSKCVLYRGTRISITRFGDRSGCYDVNNPSENTFGSLLHLIFIGKLSLRKALRLFQSHSEARFLKIYYDQKEDKPSIYSPIPPKMELEFLKAFKL